MRFCRDFIRVSLVSFAQFHPVPHFHAAHAGLHASVAIDGTILAGELQARALRFVQEWAQLHQDELLANWIRARNYEPLEPIEPLT
jgi:hypothetical protein